MADQWQTGKLTPVFQPVGRRTSGETVYRRAAFDLLQWAPVAGNDEELFVSTHGFEALNSDAVNLLSDGDAISAGGEFGFYTLDQFVSEPHEGDGVGDDIQSLHGFGYL
jgi:hypothetical protein